MGSPIVAFVLDRVKGTDEARIRMRVKWDGSAKIVAVSVGYRVNIYRWDSESQRCMPRSFHGSRRVPAAEINAEIERYEEAAKRTLKESGHNPSEAEFREALGVTLGRVKSREQGVFQAFDAFVAERGERNRWTYRTIQKMQGLKNHLKAFRPALSWDDFSEQGLYDFISYLRGLTRVNKSSPEGWTNIKDTTVEKNISALRWFLTWADRHGMLRCTDYRDFRPKLQKMDKPVVFLDWDELMTLLDFKLQDEALSRVRDVFCFCAFTSLRYSDVYALRWADVFEDHIKVTTQKTDDALVIELNRYSQEILGRYCDESYPDDKVFPVLSNQKMNVRLKELMKACGFSRLVRISEFQNGERVDRLVPKWQLITTHAARRTFISNALMMGIPPNVVMRWTGHSDYDSMKPYIAIADAARAQEMEKFNRPR